MDLRVNPGGRDRGEILFGQLVDEDRAVDPCRLVSPFFELGFEDVVGARDNDDFRTGSELLLAPFDQRQWRLSGGAKCRDLIVVAKQDDESLVAIEPVADLCIGAGVAVVGPPGQIPRMNHVTGSCR